MCYIDLTTSEPPISNKNDYKEDITKSSSIFIPIATGIGALLSVLVFLTVIFCCCYSRYKFRRTYNTRNPTQEDFVVSASNHYELIEPETAQSDHDQQLDMDSSFGVPVYDNIPADTNISNPSEKSSDSLISFAAENQLYDTIPSRQTFILASPNEAVYNCLSYNLEARSQQSRMEQCQYTTETVDTTDTQYDALDHQVKILCLQAEDQYDVIESEDVAKSTCQAQDQESTLRDLPQGKDTHADQESCVLYSVVNKESNNFNYSCKALHRAERMEQLVCPHWMQKTFQHLIMTKLLVVRKVT